MTHKPEVSETAEGFRFPCDYQIKAMGLDDGEFTETVVEIVANHCQIDERLITCRGSANGKYLSVSVTVQAESREQLDAIYDALTAHEKVLMRL